MQSVQSVPVSVIAPAWAVVPVAAVIILSTLWYVWRLQQRRDMPTKRRRIRTANAVAMALLAALFAYGLCGVTTAQGRLFVGVWVGVISLTFVMAALAAYDALFTATLTLRAAGELKRELRRGRGPGNPT